MRISDWSSDVCSSDLAICRAWHLPSSAYRRWAISRRCALSKPCSTASTTTCWHRWWCCSGWPGWFGATSRASMPATIRRRRTEMAGHPDRLRGSALFTPFTLVLGLLVLIGGFFLLKRFIFGLGAVTHLSAGYPWGIWVTWDLIIGSALGCAVLRWRSEEHTSELQ